MLSANMFLVTFIVLLICGAAVKGDFDDMDPEIVKKCVEEAGITKEELMDAHKDQKKVTQEILCASKCIFEKRGLIKDGQFDAGQFPEGCFSDDDLTVQSCEDMVKAKDCFGPH